MFGTAAPKLGRAVQQPSGAGRRGSSPVVADVADRAKDTGPRQNRTPHRSEESIFNRPNKLIGM